MKFKYQEEDEDEDWEDEVEEEIEDDVEEDVEDSEEWTHLNLFSSAYFYCILISHYIPTNRNQ